MALALKANGWTIYAVLLKSKPDREGNCLVLIRVTNRRTSIDVELYTSKGERVKCHPEEFRDGGIPKHNLHNAVIHQVKGAIYNYVASGKPFNKQVLLNHVYGQLFLDTHKKRRTVHVNIPSTLGTFLQLPKKEVTSLLAEVPMYDSDTGEQIIEDEDDFNRIVKEEKSIKERKAQQVQLAKEIEAMSPIQRYEKGYFDKTNLFELLGLCRYGRVYNAAKKKHERLIPKSYDPLMITLTDYRINATPPESVKSFDYDWIVNFFVWIRDNGYIQNIGKHTMNFNPFKPDVEKFKNKNRLPYKGVNSFYTKVKEFKRYTFELKKLNYLKDNYYDRYDATTFHNFVDNQDYEAKYYIHPKAFLKIMNASLLDKALDHTRDVFVCQTLLGGIPPADFYNQDKMKLKNTHSDELIIRFRRQKTGGKIINPVLQPVLNITKKYNNELPPPIVATTKVGRKKLQFSEVVYTKQLRKLFEVVCPNEMWSEDVADMATGGYLTSEAVPLYTVISPRFARSTSVVLFYSLGMKKEVIASFTGHKKMDIFEKHYFTIFQEHKKREGDKALAKAFGNPKAEALLA